MEPDLGCGQWQAERKDAVADRYADCSGSASDHVAMYPGAYAGSKRRGSIWAQPLRCGHWPVSLVSCDCTTQAAALTY